MPMIAPESGKTFSKPNTGKYVGTIIDVIDLGICKPKTPNPAFPNQEVHRVQIVWVLNVNGTDGNPIEYSEAPPFKMGEGTGKFKPTRLFEIASGAFQGAPPRPFDVETLLGKSNELFIVKTGDGNDARSQIAGFLPVPAGVVPPPPPSGFIRKVNRPQQSQPQQTQPQTQYGTSTTQPQQEVKF